MIESKKALTRRQREIVDFLRQFIGEHNYSPSYREMMAHFEISSTASIHKHLVALEKKGYLSMEKKASRSIVLKDESHPTTSSEFSLPFMGYVSEGLPIETFAQFKTLSVPMSLVASPEQSYVLQVKGDSLTEELLGDGDLLIVEPSSHATAGDTIIAVINGQETVIKKYAPEGNYINLISRNSHHTPIVVREESLTIQGVLTGLLRDYL
jgi:repressor LexA